MPAGTPLMQSADDSLMRAADFIPQGLAVFDSALRLVQANARYGELLHLSPELVAPGTSLYAIALFLAERGDLGAGEPELLARRRVETLTESAESISQRRGDGGRVLEFDARRTPDGGLTISFADVTARVDAELELARVNQSLEQRVEERTAALTRVNAELEARSNVWVVSL